MNKGRFLLKTMDKYGQKLYYQASGVVNVDSETETPYLHMTSYRKDAQMFFSIKAARAVGRKLMHEHGLDMQIITLDGRVV